jgi:hypothetical protein
MKFFNFMPDSHSEIDQAIDQSETHMSEAQKWQAYLNELALLSLCEWLKSRSPQLKPKIQRHLYRPAQSYLQVNSFRIHVSTLGCLLDDAIAIPKSVISDSLPPDFYVLVEVYEEVQRSHLFGFLHHNQVRQHQSTFCSSFPADSDAASNSLIPLTQFDRNLDHLLLLLRHLEQPSPVLSRKPKAPQLLISQPLIDVTSWFKNELDGVARSSNWVLLPPLVLGVMRSSFDPKTP